MGNDNVQKLEIIEQFKTKYPGLINPDLYSMKYCQDDLDAYLEMFFSNVPANPVVLNLDFISGDVDGEPETWQISLLFNPDADVVDNATAFVELDQYSLINCVEKLFTPEAEQEISNTYLKNSRAL